jgi:acyl dehydratase
MARVVSAKELREMAGEDLGVSRWLEVDQDLIDGFANVTNDHQFIHTDPKAAAQTPFGSTIAHGFLTLSLVVPLLYELAVFPENMVMGINYGMNHLRFLNPVKVDTRIRLHVSIVDVTEKSPGRLLVNHDVRVEIEGEEKPALVGEFLTLDVLGG